MSDTLGKRFYEMFGELDKKLQGRTWAEASEQQKRWLVEALKKLADSGDSTTNDPQAPYGTKPTERAPAE